MKLTECDGCGKKRRDVRSIGKDSNGDPDSPDWCFICRKEWEKNRKVYSCKLGAYVPFGVWEGLLKENV